MVERKKPEMMILKKYVSFFLDFLRILTVEVLLNDVTKL
jgi:hypothetical protein